MSPRKIIIDTDPGKDDAVAILLALASPELDVLALTAVAGNVPLARTERNARALLALGGRPDIGVYPGCPRPLMRLPITAEHIHGDTGLTGLVLPEPTTPAQPEHGVDTLIRLLRAAPAGEITLCLLGPATNLAVALVKAPDIAPRVAELVWMAGSSTEGGNVTAAAEFNVHADPEAAHIVMTAGMPTTLAPMDLTHQLRLDAPRRTALGSIDTQAARAVATLFAADEAAPLHDPCVIAHLLQPGLFTGARRHVAIETQGVLTLGTTVVDRRVRSKPPNATWLDQAQPEAFFALLFDRLARLS